MIHGIPTRKAAALLAAVVLLAASAASSGLLFDKAEYAARRARLMEKIPDGVAVILGAQPRADYYDYHQNNDFFYLCGVEAPNAVLIVDGLRKETILVFSATEKELRNEGLSPDILKDPVAVTGVDRVLPAQELTGVLGLAAARSKVIYTGFKPEELMREASFEKFRTLQKNMVLNPWDGRLTREGQFVKLLKENFPGVEVKDCSPLIWELRTVKSPAEIEVLRTAARVGVKAANAMMRATRPGMYEYEIAAVWEYVAKREGAEELAYNIIISSGENHPYVHYYKHDRRLKEGDFLVVDAGPVVNQYVTDISLSVPANGKFTARQKEVYEAAKAVHEANMRVYRPGLTAADCRKEVTEILRKQGYDIDSDLFKRIRPGFGHYVGLSVHDVGGGPMTLKAGMVFANEPMTIFPAEELGVRVEDTVLITETGCEVLTAGVAREVKDIEALMKKDGIPQVLKKAGL